MAVVMMGMIIMMLNICTRGEGKTITFPFVFTNAAIGTTHTNRVWLVCGSGTLEGYTGLQSTENNPGGVRGTQKAGEVG